jgi:chemotaxis-related protein WspD
MSGNKKHTATSCWNKIGVWGEEDMLSCPKLKDVIHCRNCDVFINGGRSLLNSTPPPGYLTEWTKQIANKKEEITENSDSVIVFRLENEWLALPAAIFQEIDNIRTIHRIPYKTDGVFLGLTNIKGELQLCFSLKAFMGTGVEKDISPSEIATSSKRKFLVIKKEGSTWVFPVDEIVGIYKYNMQEILNIPSTVSKVKSTFTKTIFKFKEKTVGVLDDELIIYALKRRIE